MYHVKCRVSERIVSSTDCICHVLVHTFTDHYLSLKKMPRLCSLPLRFRASMTLFCRDVTWPLFYKLSLL